MTPIYIRIFFGIVGFVIAGLILNKTISVEIGIVLFVVALIFFAILKSVLKK